MYHFIIQCMSRPRSESGPILMFTGKSIIHKVNPEHSTCSNFKLVDPFLFIMYTLACTHTHTQTDMTIVRPMFRFIHSKYYYEILTHKKAGSIFNSNSYSTSIL